MIIRGPPATAPKPPVAVIAAGGDVQGLLASAGYVTTSTSATPQERTVVYWDQRRVTREETARIAGTVDADDRIEIRGGLPIPRAVLEREAPVVVVVGSG
jgi:hypothetical protein